MKTWSNLRRGGCTLCALALLLAALPPLAVAAGNPALAYNPGLLVLPTAQSTGTTTLTWDSGNTSIFPEYYVSMDGQPDSGPFPFVATPSGSYALTNVPCCHTFTGKLYTKGKGTLLATATLRTEHFSCGPACTSVQPTAPLTLTPTKLLTTQQSSDGTSWECDVPWPDGFYDQGLGPSYDVTRTDALAVGYENIFHKGADPFPCNEWANYFFRGGVGFDMNQVIPYVNAHGLKSAMLTFDLSSGEPTCLSHIEVSDDAWESWTSASQNFIPGGTLQLAPPNPNGIIRGVDVSDVVALQVGFNSTDAHFVFVGLDESLSGQGYGECLNVYTNFALTITPAH
jgi:hypothetical protein